MKRSLFACLLLMFQISGCKKNESGSRSTLTTIDASAISANSVTTGGEIAIDGGSAISKQGICYATHPTPTVGDSIFLDASGSTSFTTILNNLFPYTKYYARAFAINASGTAYGNEIVFTTLPGLPTITTTAVTHVIPLSANSGGNILSDGGSPIKARGICWSTSPNPTTASFKTINSATTTSFTDTLKPLGSQLTYYVRAYVTNDFGAAYGNEISFTSVSGDAVTDIDGNVYPYITIGTQTWMTVNLKTTHYQNGDPVIDGFAGNSAFYRTMTWLDPQNTTGAYTYPNNDSIGTAGYGKLYDNYSMSDPRGICPSGWHVPTDEDWKILEIQEGMNPDTADFPRLPIASYPFDNGYRGTIGDKFLAGGSSGLNLPLAGVMNPDPPAPVYSVFNLRGYYWTSSVFAMIAGVYWIRVFNPAGYPGAIYRTHTDRLCFSIRCIKN